MKNRMLCSILLVVLLVPLLAENDKRRTLDDPVPRLFATSFGVGIVELSPGTGDVLNTMEPPIRISVFDAMAYDGSSLFLLNHGSDSENIYELNPDSGEVVAKHPIDSKYTSFGHGMAALNGKLYILNSALEDIYIFDPSIDAVIGTIDVDEVNPGHPDKNLDGGLAAIKIGGDGLISSTAGDNIVEIDPNSGLIVNSFPQSESGDIGMGVVSGEIYVGKNTGSSDQITVYSRTGAELRKLDVPGSIGIQSIGADDVDGFPASPRANLIFTQYADGDAAGFKNKTRIVLMAGELPESGEVRFFDGMGVAQFPGIGGVNMSSVPYDLPAFGTVEISTDGTGALKNGPVEVFSDRGASSAIMGAEVFELLGNTVSVPDAPPGNSHRVYINFNAEEQTAIAVFNPDDNRTVTLRLVLLDANGSEQGTATLELAPREQKAIFLNDPALFASLLTGDFRGALTVTSAAYPVSVLSLIQKKSTGALIVVKLE